MSDITKDLPDSVVAFYNIGRDFVYASVIGTLMATYRGVDSLSEFLICIFVLLCFFGGDILGSIIMLTKVVKRKLCLPFGSALFYGTLFLYAFLYEPAAKIGINNIACLLIILSVILLICFFIWRRDSKKADK